MALSKSSLEDITDTVRCPICDEIPPGEILMCQFGHSICRVCFDKLQDKVCPTCRGRYGTPVARNFALESTIAKLPIACPHLCGKQILRAKLSEHEKTCEEWTKFHNVNLCKLLHLGDSCTFQVNTTDASSAIPHFKNVHRAFLHHRMCADLWFQNSSRPTFEKRSVSVIFKAPQQFFERDGNAESYLMLYRFTREDMVAWTCLYLGNSTGGAAANYEMMLTFTSKNVLCCTPWKIPVEEVQGLRSTPPATHFSRDWLTQKGCFQDNTLPYRIEIVRK